MKGPSITPFTACDDDLYLFKWGFNDVYINTSGEAMIFVEGGKADYSWEVSGSGFSLESATTSVPYNTLIADGTVEDGDIASITVTDACSNEVSGTVTCCSEIDCCNEVSYYITTQNKVILEGGSSVTIGVNGGCPPFDWEITDGDYTLKYSKTSGRTNIVYKGDDPWAEFTVTDACDNTSTAYVISAECEVDDVEDADVVGWWNFDKTGDGNWWDDVTERNFPSVYLFGTPGQSADAKQGVRSVQGDSTSENEIDIKVANITDGWPYQIGSEDPLMGFTIGIWFKTIVKNSATMCFSLTDTAGTFTFCIGPEAASLFATGPNIGHTFDFEDLIKAELTREVGSWYYFAVSLSYYCGVCKAYLFGEDEGSIYTFALVQPLWPTGQLIDEDSVTGVGLGFPADWDVGDTIRADDLVVLNAPLSYNAMDQLRQGAHWS